VTPDLRQMRYFVAVAERGSFTRAADDLYVAQQAVSQQIKALESALGVTLLQRDSRRVTLTPEGAVFLSDCKRVLAAADRAVRRVRAAAVGEVGTIRIVYTLATAYHTVPALLARMTQRFPQLKLEAREVFAGVIPRLLETEECDVALAPAASYPPGIVQRIIRQEPLRLAVGDRHPLAKATSVELARLAGDRLELWPREMSPGYYDAILSACRAAGFEPDLDEHAAGSTVWGFIAQGRGVGLVVSSLNEQLPRGVRLLDLAPPQPPPLAIAAVWSTPTQPPALQRFLQTAVQLSSEDGWL
jgi:DNA-binding transcriptional LysR family regulator